MTNASESGGPALSSSYWMGLLLTRITPRDDRLSAAFRERSQVMEAEVRELGGCDVYVESGRAIDSAMDGGGAATSAVNKPNRGV